MNKVKGKEIRIGAIGCGGRLRHVAAELLKQSPLLKVVALSDPSPISIKAARERLNPEAVVYDDYRELVRAKDIDWVMIGSWNCFHREHTVAAFTAGKNVFCEKPLATTMEDCIAMDKAWKKSKKTFNIGFTLRYSPHYRKIHELLEQGVVGDIISMEFNETIGFNHGGYIMGDWRRLTKNAGTHLLEKCSHDIDLTNWMVGSKAGRVASFGGLDFYLPENEYHVKRIGKNKDGKPAYQTWPGMDRQNPFTSKKDIIDNQVVIMEYENKVRATFHINCNSGIPERRMCILGTEGAIRADVMAGILDVCRIGFDKKTGRENYAEKVIMDPGASGGHGGGDVVLAKELAATMMFGEPAKAGLRDGLLSAVTCFGIDTAMNTGKVVNMAPFWKKAGVK